MLPPLFSKAWAFEFVLSCFPQLSDVAGVHLQEASIGDPEGDTLKPAGVAGHGYGYGHSGSGTPDKVRRIWCRIGLNLKRHCLVSKFDAVVHPVVVQTH